MPLILNGSGSVNKVTVTAPTNGSTFTVADGKTVAINSTLTFTGTDGTTFTFPSSTTNIVGDSTFTSNQLLATSGYQKLPGGIILQWGITASLAAGAFTVTFPIAFPNAGYFATNIPTTLNAVAQTAPLVTALTTTNFSGSNSTGVSSPFRWFALGY